jgi:hypothetical protein
VQKPSRKGFYSLVILGAWILSEHRKSCVFDGSAPCIETVLQAFKDEAHLWLVGGAKGLAGLGLGRISSGVLDLGQVLFFQFIL